MKSLILFGLCVMALANMAFSLDPGTHPANDGKAITAMIIGGHETDPEDRGRPVVLVAAGLNVPTEVFRKAFSKVKPAGPGRGPTEEEARKNKDALLGELSKYGVTNDRLDEVSNFYRYRRQNGEIWQHADAIVNAIIRDGQVIGFKIDAAGYGYSSPPTVTVEGASNLKTIVKLHFETDLKKNGSIESITIAK